MPGDIPTAVTKYRLALALNRSQGPAVARNMLIEALEIFFTYAKLNTAAHPLMWVAISSYVELRRNEFGLTEQDAQAEVSALAYQSAFGLTS